MRAFKRRGARLGTVATVFTVAVLAHDAALELTSEDEEGLTFKTLRGIVDDLNLSPVSPEGQILKLVKSLQY